LTIEIRINHLTGRQQFVVNDSFPIPYTQSITFLGVNPGFTTVCVASPCIDRRSFSYIIVVIHFSLSVLTIIRRWKFDSLNFSLLNHVAPKSSFLYPVFFKWFKTILWLMFSFLPISWLLMCQSYSTFSVIGFIDFSSDWSTRVKCIFDIKISRLKTLCARLKLALCHTYWYCIMSINITNFFSSLSRILSFFCNKTSKWIEFLLYFRSFSRRNNFWLNKQISLFF